MTHEEMANFLEELRYSAKEKEIVLDECSDEQRAIYKGFSNYYNNLVPAAHSMSDMKTKGFHKNLCVLEQER